MTAIKLVTGKIEKFILVIDPENRKGKVERIEFNDNVSLSQRLQTLLVADRAEYNKNPGRGWDETESMFFTYYRRDDNGEIVEQNTYSIPLKGRPPIKVGDAAYMSKCKCGEITWSEFPSDEQHRSYITGEHLCPNCNKPDQNDYYFSNYDGMQEREY